MKEMRIIIAGGRRFNDYILLDNTMTKYIKGCINNNIITNPSQVKIISGCAIGADTLGEKFARLSGLNLERFPADWNNLGKKAGILRNIEMAKYATSDDAIPVLFAFWNGNSRGTKHMIETANKYGMEVHIVKYLE